MIPKENSYPVFESNQVLTNAHLNQMLEYLDEQTRLSRTNLIGVGVVCGLEVGWSKNNSTITVTKGCGVTTEGYLANIGVAGDETGNCTPFLISDFSADRFKVYTVPNKPGYAKFHNGCDRTKPQYELWQLIPAGAAEYDTATQLDEDFLKNKVALLHVEVNSEQLKNCSPNSCDDKGSETAFTVRPLLISKANAEKLIIGLPGQDTLPNLPERIGLPDLRMPRLNVPNTNMVDARKIFDAYRDLLVGNSVTLFDQVAKALSEAEQVFGPVVKPVVANYQFVAKLKALENQFRSLFQFNFFGGSKFPVFYAQYYYDLLSDLIQAYDEFRRKGLELMSLCCPHEELFPRHLLLGEVFSTRTDNWRELRHYFRPSIAIAHAETTAEEVRQLFKRIVLMIDKFRLTSRLPEGIRITPSVLGDVPLSKKAIPYYYFDEDGETPLHQCWDFEKTRIGKANQNLGYFSFDYGKDDFVKNPLGYDLEPYNFFRIEGHIGRSWTEVLKTLMTAIRTFRLPFDVVVLNADNLAVEDKDNPWKNRCIDNDLDVIHRIWVNEVNCLYQQKIGTLTQPKLTRGMLAAAAAGLATKKEAPAPPPTRGSRGGGTLGATAMTAGFATFASARPTASVVSQPSLFATTSFTTAALLPSTSPIFSSVNPTTSAIGSSILTNIDRVEVNTPDKLKAEVSRELANNSEFSNLSVKEYRVVAEHKVNVVADMLAVTEELVKPSKSLNYGRLEKQFGLLDKSIRDFVDDLIIYNPNDKDATMTEAEVQALIKELQALQSSCLRKRLEELKAEMDAKQKAIDELIWFSRYATNHPDMQHKAGVPAGGTFVLVFRETPNDLLIGNLAVGGRKLLGYEIPEGKVLADFYIPTRCCSDCPPVKFVLPPSRPVFTVTLGCPNENDVVFAKIEVTHGIAPFEIRVDGGEYLLLSGGVELNPGEHTLVVRDSEGGESLAKKVTTGQRMLVRAVSFECDDSNEFYEAKLRIEHGQPPFKLNDAEVAHEDGANDEAGVFFITTPALPSGQTTTVTIGDASDCEPFKLELNHSCETPVIVAQPDTGSTDAGTPVVLNVLANDTGQGLKVTAAKLENPNMGTVVRNDDGTLTFTPSAQATGQNVVIEYEVQDANNVSASSTVTVSVKKKSCDLPGDGKAASCRYRFWLPIPAGENQYKKATFKFSRLLVNGNIDLAPLAPPFPDDVAALTPDNFDATVKGWVEELNDVVQSNVPSAQKDWWKIAYDSMDGVYAMLRIEHFTALDFEIQVQGNYRMGNTQTDFTARLNQKDGTVATESRINLDSKFELPPFDCIDFDKCSNTEQARCKGEIPKVRIEIKNVSRQGSQNVVELEGIDLAGNVSQWFWDMGQGISQLPNNRITVASFRNNQGNLQPIRLFGFAKNGCFGMATRVIDLG